ncbi:MAG: tRNA glutamyl-Q(34) synthetase GluQRS [Verrucomicrobiota bacterium]
MKISNLIPTTRFAPSPTGELHLGHAYAAKVAHDLAREQNGLFLLRHEDIDSSRVREEYYTLIETDLRWLGLNWDGEIVRQSHRPFAYRDALEKLKQQGLVYPCFCTRKDIQQSLSAPHGAAENIYPGICRNIPSEESVQRIANGEAHAWRFDSNKAAAIHGELSFNDLRFGKTQVKPLANGDAVLARRDIGIAYHLAVVVDDAFQNITHVTRGDDLFESTHIHRQLQAVLGFPEPTYFHHPCICDETGKRLAKRDDARSIRTLREAGTSTKDILTQIELSLLTNRHDQISNPLI